MIPETRTSLEPAGVDFFICHASEDKGEVARPLAEQLQAHGYQVWYDDFRLRIGDSLRQKIDEGLAACRFGVVILSPSFFRKNWPKWELDGLVARQLAGKGKILPIWHHVSFDEVASYSPPLADKVAARTTNGVADVAKKVIQAIDGTAVSSPHGARLRVLITLRELAPEILGVEAEAVVEEASFKDDLDADELDLVELMMGVEERLDITVLEDELRGIQTVGQAVDLIVAKLELQAE